MGSRADPEPGKIDGLGAWPHDLDADHWVDHVLPCWLNGMPAGGLARAG
ncbi:hypothetical protein [Thiocapsa imhoffii]|nr:hypothetical protein [Thiocapsa imhoffii]